MIRIRVFTSLAAAGAFCVCVVAAQETKTGPKKAPAPARAPKSMAQADLKWETDPESKVSIAVLTGNPKTGAYEAFLKFPAGISVPLHWHTFSNTGVGVSGTVVIETEGQAPVELGPGSWGFIPGRMKHTTKCKEGADCVIYARQPGKDDIHFVNPPAAPAKEPPNR